MGSSQNLHKSNYLQLQLFQVLTYISGVDLNPLIADLEHKLDLRWSNRRWSSIVIQGSFTDLVDSVSFFSVVSLYYIALLSFLFKFIVWNLSALAITLVNLNQLTANSDSCSKVFKSSVNPFVASALFLYPLKALERLTVFCCF